MQADASKPKQPASEREAPTQAAAVPSDQSPQVQRGEDFENLYANNVRFESSVWDLKLLFGQLDQGTGAEIINLHTAMTIPWPAAKVMLHFLRLNIEIHEMENGKITMNAKEFPQMPAPLSAEHENNELFKAAHKLAVKMRAEFIADQERP